MEFSIAEFAAHRGVSLQRARELARQGKVPARREGHRWIITRLDTVRRTRRRLGEQTKADLIVYLRTRTLDHVKGMRKRRLADVADRIRQASNPAALVREYFDGAPPPQGPIGAAVVRAALRGLDEAANIALRAQHKFVIDNAAELGKRIMDSRLIRHMTAAQLAAQVRIPERTLRMIERAAFDGLDQILARKLAFAVRLPIAKMSIRPAG